MIHQKCINLSEMSQNGVCTGLDFQEKIKCNEIAGNVTF